MKFIPGALLVFAILISKLHDASPAAPLQRPEKPESAVAENTHTPPIFGYLNSADENQVESRFLAVPDRKLAQEHLRILTQAPHIAGSPVDKVTSDFVARRRRASGVDTEIGAL